VFALYSTAAADVVAATAATVMTSQQHYDVIVSMTSFPRRTLHLCLSGSGEIVFFFKFRDASKFSGDCCTAACHGVVISGVTGEL